MLPLRTDNFPPRMGIWTRLLKNVVLSLLGFVRTRVLISRSRLNNGVTHGGWHFDSHRDFDTRGCWRRVLLLRLCRNFCGCPQCSAVPYRDSFLALDCSIVPTCGAWGSATAAKRGPLKQSWAGIQHSRGDEPLGVLMQMRNVRVNGFFFFLLWEYFPVC